MRRKLLKTADIARMLGIDESTVRRWAGSGRLPCYQTIGGHRRYSPSKVEEFIARYHLEGIVSEEYVNTSRGEEDVRTSLLTE